MGINFDQNCGDGNKFDQNCGKGKLAQNISFKLKGKMSCLDMKWTALGDGEMPIFGVAKK